MQFSKAARDIYERYTDLVENYGLDEAWLDVSGCGLQYKTGGQLANEIRETITRELGITVSIGVSWNKIFAKLASDMRKPDKVTIISKNSFKEKVWPLPASDLLYVGPSTTRKLRNFGIYTIGDLAQIGSNFLIRQFGKWGEHLWAFSNGYDLSPVAPVGFSNPIKSIGNSMTTYRDIESREEAWQVLLALAESVCRRLRENGLRAKTVHISGRYNNLSWFECQTKLQLPCCTVEDLSRPAMKLLCMKTDFSTPLRSLGIRGSDLTDLSGGIQLTFGTNPLRQERLERIEGCVDIIRNRFGQDIVRRATLINADIIGDRDKLTHEIHPVAYFK